VHERHLARQRHVAPAGQPPIGDGVMGGTERPRGDKAVRSLEEPATR
jgi:hypothetical protein